MKMMTTRINGVIGQPDRLLKPVSCVSAGWDLSEAFASSVSSSNHRRVGAAREPERGGSRVLYAAIRIGDGRRTRPGIRVTSH
jgi:hypothetical protein